MNLLALLAPAVLGYASLFLCHWSRHWLNRQTGYKLFFTSVTAGWLLFAVSEVLVILANPHGHPGAWWPNWYHSWQQILYPAMQKSWFVSSLGIQQHVNVLATAFLLALAPPMLNYWVGRERSSRLVAKSHGDLLCCLLHDVSKKSNGLVQVTTKSGKVYVGFPTDDGLSSQASEGERYFAMVPVTSGYRTKRQRVCYTTHYDVVLGDYVGTPNFEDLSVSIPMREVASARPYHHGVHLLLRARRGQTGP